MSISIISTILFLLAILSLYKQFYCHFIQLILSAWSFFILIFCILYGLLYRQTLSDRFSPFYSTMKSVFKRTGRVWFFQKQSPGGFCEKGVLRNFAKSTGKQLRQSLLFPTTSLKKRLRYRCLPVNFAKSPRTPFFTEHLWCLLLLFLMCLYRVSSQDIYACLQTYILEASTGGLKKTLLKKRLWHRCFPVNFTKFSRTPLDDCFWFPVAFSLDFDLNWFTVIGVHPFIKYTKFMEKQTFLTPDKHTYKCVSWGTNVRSPKNFAYVLNGWSRSKMS